MNGVNHIANIFSRSLDRLVSVIGTWGSSQPMDDSKSGILMAGKKYNVVVSMNGCYYYIDDDGRKKAVSEIPNTVDWEWVNIAEKVLKDFRTCYRTLGGKVEVWSWYLLNDEMDVLKEEHRITDSTDIDNPTGKILKSIPQNWRMIDCDLPDMTERDITFISRCYKTPNGKVEIEGLESIDDKIVTRESTYVVIQSTDINFPAGYRFGLIPSDWIRMVCDFPDMTERDIINVDECYNTGTGKVHLIGYRSIDNRIGTRQEYLMVSRTTDEEIKRNTILFEVPKTWDRIVCDFPDLTTSDTEVVENCFKTPGGKVQLRTYLTLDGEGKLRESRHMILRSTDPMHGIGSGISEIPLTWINTECDFASLTQRHYKEIKGCYHSSFGDIYVEGMTIIDNNLEEEVTELIVVESSSELYPVGQKLSRIPVGFDKIQCKCNCKVIK